MDVPGSSNLKRRRDDLDDTDDDTDDDDTDYEETNNDGFIDDESEPHRFGTSVLPVADLPASFDGIPQDGMEYLFTTQDLPSLFDRREEKHLPIVTRVYNPYPVNDTVWANQRPEAEDVNSSLPTEEWRTCFENRFRNFRANIRQPTIHIAMPHPDAYPRIPETRDRDRWWAFFRGDPDWEMVRSFQDQFKNKDWNKGETIAYDEEMPKGQGNMRGWVVYGEPLSWDQLNEDPAVEATSAQSSHHEEDVERSPEDEALPDVAPSPAKGKGKESSMEHAPPTLCDRPHPEDPADVKPISRSAPREPTLKILNVLDERTTFQLLRYFTLWIKAHFDPSSLSGSPPIFESQPSMNYHEKLPYNFTPTHARWIFALLSRVDAQLTSGEISTLRTLVREIIQVIKEEISAKDCPHDVASSKSSMGEIACWMIVAAVTGVWGQKDLWMDAEAALR